MDAKYNGKAITPRNGKVVELNALWYNANMIMVHLSKKFKHNANSKKYMEYAEKCKISFNNKFYNEYTRCLEDVIGDPKIRPNQLFALSLTYQVIDPSSKVAENIINVIEEKLLNKFGLKTLAEGEENYVAIYDGDAEKRDSSYHQGITWVWLLGLYYNSLKNMVSNTKDNKTKKKLEAKLEKLKKDTTKNFKEEMYTRGCIGNIAEIYDSEEPYLPKGAFAQAWSVAEIFRIIKRKIKG